MHERIRPSHDPWRHQGVIVEDEPTGDGGEVARVATVFLTGRECPWRCVMCDLWQYTIVEDTPIGAIPAQIADARRALQDRESAQAPVTQMKLYNAGSFFDPRAVPEVDYDDIAARLAGLSRVIVECHPSLVGPRVDRLLGSLDRASRETLSEASPPRLEVAMGLETAHPEALERLEKRFTLDEFARASDYLRRHDVALRVFLLIAPPFVPHDEQDAWLLRSIDVAFDCGASVVSIIPTRDGNPPMHAIAEAGLFRVPSLDDIERSAVAALAHARGRGRVFVDVWDLDRFDSDPTRVDVCRVRLRAMNVG